MHAAQLSEAVILDMVERMADPAKEEGEWVAKIDLVEDGPRLRLAEMPQLGKCGAECKTVQRVASELLQDHDTDMAEHLFQARAPGSSMGSGLEPCVCTGRSRTFQPHILAGYALMHRFSTW